LAYHPDTSEFSVVLVLVLHYSADFPLTILALISFCSLPERPIYIRG
jgi:hypothetical protein